MDISFETWAPPSNVLVPPRDRGCVNEDESVQSEEMAGKSRLIRCLNNYISDCFSLSSPSFLSLSRGLLPRPGSYE